MPAPKTTTTKRRFDLCHKAKGVRHSMGEPWVCRHCHKKACGSCAHHYGSNRSTVVLDKSKPQERLFTCIPCRDKL